MATRYRSELGTAIQAYVTLAFRQLRGLGYCVSQDVPNSSYRRFNRADRRMLRSLIDGLNADTARKRANATRMRDMGMIWYTYDDSDTLSRQSPRLRIHFNQVTIDDVSYGQNKEQIRAGLIVVLEANNLVIDQQELRYDDDRVFIIGVTNEIWNSAEAAEVIGGSEAKMAILHPTARKPKNP